MKQSPMVIGVMAGLVGAWSFSPVLAATSDRVLVAAVRPAELPPLVADGPIPLAQNGSSSNLTPAQQEQFDELLRQGQARVAAKDYAGAIAVYQQAAQIDPRNARLFSGMGYLYIQQGSYPEAVLAYRQAIALDSNNLAFHYGLAHSLYHSDQLDAALTVYRDIIASHPNEANAYLGIGGIQLQRQDYDGAVSTYQSLVRAVPRNAQAYEALGKLYIQREDYDQALAYLRQGLQSSANKSSLYVTMASIYLIQDNLELARETLQQALAADGNNAQAQYQMGYVQYQVGDREAAYGYLMRAVRLDPDLTAAHALLGELLLEREQYLQAVLSYRKVVEARPTDPAAFYNLGLALWGQGLRAQAMSNLDLAAVLYERQGDTAGAARARELMSLWGFQQQ